MESYLFNWALLGEIVDLMAKLEGPFGQTWRKEKPGTAGTHLHIYTRKQRLFNQ